jgi:hypothetical protein
MNIILSHLARFFFRRWNEETLKQLKLKHYHSCKVLSQKSCTSLMAYL